MDDGRKVDYGAGTDEAYHKKGLWFQIVVALLTSKTDIDFATTINHYQRNGEAVRKVSERWIDKKGPDKKPIVYGEEALRYAFLIRDGRPITGGGGENFGLVFPRIARHFFRDDYSNVRKVVASFDG